MSRDIDPLMTAFAYANQLKQTVRTGWMRRGIPNAENVAAHSYGVAFIALLLAQESGQDLDLGKVLTMALVHDLPEAVTSDIPTPSWRLFPPGSKRDIEEKALEMILANVGTGARLFAVWRELQDAETVESHVVHDADLLDMYFQASVYAEQTGNQQLDEFWQKRPAFYLPLSRSIYDELKNKVNPTGQLE